MVEGTGAACDSFSLFPSARRRVYKSQIVQPHPCSKVTHGGSPQLSLAPSPREAKPREHTQHAKWKTVNRGFRNKTKQKTRLWTSFQGCEMHSTIRLRWEGGWIRYKETTSYSHMERSFSSPTPPCLPPITSLPSPTLLTTSHVPLAGGDLVWAREAP